MRLEREHNERAWLAWTTAALGRVKRLPKLDTLLAKKKPEPKPRQSWEEQFEIMQAWAQAHNARIGAQHHG